MVQENTLPTEDESQSNNTQPVVQEASTEEKLFTQAEVNQMNSRTRREVEGRFSDYAALKTRSAELDELKQAALSETERLTSRAQEAERKANDADERIATAMIASDVKVKATQMGIVDPDAAYLLIDRAKLSYDATDGVTGVDLALTQLLEDKPYLKGQPSRAPNLNSETGQPPPVLRLSSDQQEAARLMGMTDEEYSQGL